MNKAVVIIGGIAALSHMAVGCRQVKLTEIRNKDRITDYLTAEDEMTMVFGLGKIFAYQYSNFFKEDEVIKVPDGKIQFPCFEGETFYLYVEELDDVNQDGPSQSSLSCDTLQNGTNKIEVGIYENSKFLSAVYDALKSTVVTEFRFLKEVVDKPAIYELSMEVGDECKELSVHPLVDESVTGLPGGLQYGSIDKDTINKRIGVEEFNEKPGIILASGETKAQSTASDAFKDNFITDLAEKGDIDFVANFEPGEKWFDAQGGLSGYMIAEWAFAMLVLAQAI